MLLDARFEAQQEMVVPEALLPRTDRALPELTHELLDELTVRGWATIGNMVAFTDTSGNVLMLEHNGGAKNRQGALGPHGETAQHSDPVVEQPLQTLFRGISEELGIQRPADLELWMYSRGGWVINQWPRGNDYPGQFACAISFPVFVPDSVKDYLETFSHGTEEVRTMRGFLSPEEIMAADDELLRPGVKKWLGQISTAGLLDPENFGPLQPVDFSNLYEASLKDIELQRT